MVSRGQWHGVPQRRPWPGDIELGSEIFRLGQKNEGEEVVIKPVPSSIERVSFLTVTESPRDPGVENLVTWSDFTLGTGLPVHVDGPAKDRRYAYTTGGIDATCGEFMPGPAPSSYTPASASGGATRAFDGTYGWTHYVEYSGHLYLFGGSVMAEWSGSVITVIADFANSSSAYVATTVDGSGRPTAFTTFATRGRLHANTVNTPPATYPLTADDGSAAANMAPVYNQANGAPVISDVIVATVYGYSAFLYIGFGSNATTSPKWLRWNFGTSTTEANWNADPISYQSGNPDMNQAENWAVENGSLWIAAKGTIWYLVAGSRYGTDPYSTASWARYIAGDLTQPIRNIVDNNGSPYILKADGIFTIASNGTDTEQLFPALTQSANANNGKIAGAFEDDLYVTYNNSFYRIAPDNTIESVGLDVNSRTTSQQATGTITAFAPQGTIRAYAGVQNLNGDCFVMQWGAWTLNSELQNNVFRPSIHIDAWHGPVTPAIISDTINSLFTSVVGASESRPRMYMLMKSGKIKWFLPPRTSNPSADTSYCSDTMTTTQPALYFPRFHGLFHDVNKLFVSLTVAGRSLTTTGAYVDLYYRSATNTGWTFLSSVTLADGTFVTTTIPSATGTTGLVARWIEIQVVLRNNSTAQPVVTSVSLTYSHQPDQRKTYEVYVLMADNLIWRNGVTVRQDTNTILSKLQTIINQTGTFTLRFWAGATHLVEGASDSSGISVRLATWGITHAMDDLTGALTGSVYMKLVEIT